MGRRKKGDLSTPSFDRFLQESGDVLQVADSMRKRQWFLTINESADCFRNFDDIVVSYGEKGTGYYHFAYILHDKDVVSEKGYNDILNKACENNDIDLFDRACGYIVLPDDVRTALSYAYKPKHYHLLMCFENARSWSSIKNHFVGAHVQSCISVVNSFRYLTHDTKECVARGKTKYNVEDVVFSNRGLEFFSSMQGEEINFDFFDPHKIAKYVWIDSMDSYHDFLLRFGAPQVQRWMSSINSECNIKEKAMMCKSQCGDYCYSRKFCYWDSKEGLIFVSDKELSSTLKCNASSVKLFDVRKWIDSLSLTQFGKSYYTVVLYYRLPLSDLERYLVCKHIPYYASKFGIEQGQIDIESVVDVPFVTDDFRLVVNQ